MSVIGLAHVNLKGTREEIDRLRDFYVDVVGLTQGPRPAFNFFGYWLYGGATDLLHLTEGGTHAAPAYQGVDHFALRANDYEATERRLAVLGVAYSCATVPRNGTRQIFLEDPSGNGVELLFAA